MFLYKKNIWFILANLILLYHWALSSEPQYKKYWQSCFNAVFSTPMNMRWLNFPFQPNINVETTLGHQHWINVTLSTLFRRCFVNVETTSINVRRLNFHFQPNINAETTLMKLDDQRCFNVDSTLMCLLGECNMCLRVCVFVFACVCVCDIKSEYQQKIPLCVRPHKTWRLGA